MPTDLELGVEGGKCYPNDTCNTGLVCESGRCAISPPADVIEVPAEERDVKSDVDLGSEGGQCYPNDTCNTGLVCKSGRCTLSPPADVIEGPSDVRDVILDEMVDFGQNAPDVLEIFGQDGYDAEQVDLMEDSGPSTGTEGGGCYGNGTCNTGLTCDLANICVLMDNNPNEFEPTICSGDECGGSSTPFGTEVGSYRGVAAYSNGSSTGCHKCSDREGTEADAELGLDCGCRCGCDSSAGSFGQTTPQTRFGIAFQCVEYVRRFYAVRVGNAAVGNSTGNADAYSSATKLKALGLDWYPNGSSTQPEPDDAIVFTGGSFGHIAIVTAVQAGSVSIIQQNTQNALEDLPVTRPGGTWVLSSPPGYKLNVAGWFRDPKHDWTLCPDGACPRDFTCADGFCVLGGVCTPNWSCSSWSTCGCTNTQTRTCTDQNGCGTSAGKPSESQSCNHCGNASCDCGETFGTCSQDCSAPAEVCNAQDDDFDGVIDDLESCWVPVYRYWNTSMSLSARARCWGNSPSSPPAGCNGFVLEFSGPVFYLYKTEQAGTASLIHFYKGNDHLLLRSWDGEINSVLANGYTQGASIGYIWTNSSTPPSGTFYQPSGASSPNIRNLRRYLNSSAGIHLFANNPEETAPGWTAEGVKGYVWSSRW